MRGVTSEVPVFTVPGAPLTRPSAQQQPVAVAEPIQWRPKNGATAVCRTEGKKPFLALISLRRAWVQLLPPPLDHCERSSTPPSPSHSDWP